MKTKQSRLLYTNTGLEQKTVVFSYSSEYANWFYRPDAGENFMKLSFIKRYSYALKH